MGTTTMPASREDLERQIDRNYTAFEKLLPDIIQEQRGKFALMQDGQIVEFFDTLRDAQAAGACIFSDGLYSVQRVTDLSIDLGYFSHAVYQRAI